MLNVTAQHNNIGMERRDGPFSQYTTPVPTFVVVESSDLTTTTADETISAANETPTEKTPEPTTPEEPITTSKTAATKKSTKTTSKAIKKETTSYNIVDDTTSAATPTSVATNNNVPTSSTWKPFAKDIMTQPGQSTTISRLPTNNLSIGTPLATTTTS